MTDSLIQRMRKARERAVEVEGFRFTIRRPTDYEALRMFQGEDSFYDLARCFVVDWSGVTEAELVPSGGSEAVPFDRVLWEEWLQDRPDFWEPIAQAVLKAYQAHQAQGAATAKN